MLRIFTANVSYAGPDRIDITRGGAENAQRHHDDPGAGAALAPSRGLLSWGLKEMGPRTVADEQRVFPAYAQKYRDEMRSSWRDCQPAWRELLTRKSVVLVCFCQRACFCHRTIAAQLLVAASRGQAMYCGELWPDGGLWGLTLHPEWAWAVVYAGKNYENRPLARFDVAHRWLAIHGGANLGGLPLLANERAGFRHRQALRRMLDRCAEMGKQFQEDGALDDVLRRGRGIVALARVDSIEETTQRHGWKDGPFAYRLAEVVPLVEPIPAKGKQGFWSLDPGALRQIADVVPSRIEGGHSPALSAYLEKTLARLDIAYE